MALAPVTRPFDEPIDGVGVADDGAEVARSERDVVRGEVDLSVVFDT